MKWAVGIEVRNSAWLTWKRLLVEAESEAEAARAALQRAEASKERWAEEHDDYCPMDFRFRIIGIVQD